MSFNKSGSKYLRAVPCITDGKVDVYAVLDAFAVTCPARQHAIKKLLCTGIRGKGDSIQDLREAADAVRRAVQMEEMRLICAAAIADVKRDMGEREETVGWVNINAYMSHDGYKWASQVYPTREEADTGATSNRISCQPITVVVPETEPTTQYGGCEGYIKAERESLCVSCIGAHCMIDPVPDLSTCLNYRAKEEPKAERKASLCHSCHADNCESAAIIACEETGECPRYISALRENMLDAKQETSGPEQIGQNCDTAWCVHYSQLFLRNCQKYGSEEIKGCAYYHKTPETKQEAPTSAVLPSTHTDPSTNCKDCFNAACVGKGRDLTCDQGCERFMSKEIAR